MSFSCEHCGYQNNEIQNAGKIAEKGVKITLTVSKSKDLNRQVVKSDYTSVRIPHLDFEIPARSQKGGSSKIIYQHQLSYRLFLFSSDYKELI